MTTAAEQRYAQKADALYEAWTETLGRAPSHHALVLGLAVAELETNLGDWSGSHNWGGVYKRVLTPLETAKLAASAIKPTGDAGLKAARALLPAGPNEILRIDTAPPPRGAYFVWSWAFPNDVEGAKLFVHVLVQTRPSVASIIDTASPADLARAMYVTHYFEGNSPDPETNIAAYGKSIAKHLGPIDAALATWAPSAPAPVPAPPSPPPLPPVVVPPGPPIPLPPPPHVPSPSPAAPGDGPPPRGVGPLIVIALLLAALASAAAWVEVHP